MSAAPDLVHRALRAEWERERGRSRGCAVYLAAARLVLAWGSVAALVASLLWSQPALTMLGLLGAAWAARQAGEEDGRLRPGDGRLWHGPPLVWWSTDRRGWLAGRVLRRSPWLALAAAAVVPASTAAAAAAGATPWLGLATGVAVLALYAHALFDALPEPDEPQVGCLEALPSLAVMAAAVAYGGSVGWTQSGFGGLIFGGFSAVIVTAWIAGPVAGAVRDSWFLLRGGSGGRVAWILGAPLGLLVAYGLVALGVAAWTEQRVALQGLFCVALVALTGLLLWAALQRSERHGLLLPFDRNLRVWWDADRARGSQPPLHLPRPSRVVPQPHAVADALWNEVRDRWDAPRSEWSSAGTPRVERLFDIAFMTLRVAAAAIGPVAAGAAVWTATWRPGFAVSAILVATLFGRRLVDLERPATLYLLGVDHVDRERLAVRTDLLCVLVAGAIGALLVAAWARTPDAWIAAGLVVVGLVLRVGLRGFVDRAGTAATGFGVFALAAALLVVGSFDVDAWLLPAPILLALAAGATLVGLTGLYRRLHTRSEPAHRAALAEEAWSGS